MGKQTKVVLLLITLISIDLILKLIFDNSFNVYHFGPISFKFLANHGVSLGQLGDTNPIVRIVIVSTLFSFLTTLYIGLVFYVCTKKELWTLRLGLSLLYTGFAGNALDRIRLGYVIDFIEINYFRGYVFNFADIVQLIGILLTLYSLFTLSDIIWKPDNLRKFQIINRRFQLKFSKMIVICGLVTNFITGCFGYSLIVALLPQGDTRNEALLIFGLGTIIIILVQSIILFLFGISYAHGIAGPIFGMKIFLKDLLSDKRREYRVRRTDKINPELEDLGKDILEIYDKNKGNE